MLHIIYRFYMCAFNIYLAKILNLEINTKQFQPIVRLIFVFDMLDFGQDSGSSEDFPGSQRPWSISRRICRLIGNDHSLKS